jgi:hypothetical protein
VPAGTAPAGAGPGAASGAGAGAGAAGDAGAVAHFLDRLAREGYAVGVRERLAVHALLERLAAAGDLPAEPDARLALLAPLLARSRDEQRRFHEIVAAYRAEAARRPLGAGGARRAGRPRAGGAGAPAAGPADPRRGREAVAALVLALLVVAALLWSRPAPRPAAPRPPGRAQTRRRSSTRGRHRHQTAS